MELGSVDLVVEGELGTVCGGRMWVGDGIRDAGFFGHGDSGNAALGTECGVDTGCELLFKG